MIRSILAAAALAALPMAALAMPSVGDIVGTTPDTAKAALEKAGCTVDRFEAEDGKIEAKCVEVATGKHWEIYLDPKTGAVVDLKNND
ncbi:MAG: PepSY domain-containing protein [Rhodobacteraceae bacterium]|nr:PepSY domain-containing protein [Paracoccaceae bacterium]